MQMKKTKVLTVLGTRPEIIRLSLVINALEKHADHTLVHTGQNYDYTLNEIFFEDLNIRKPDHFLNVDTSSLGTVLGGVLTSIEPVLAEEKPDAVLVLGDTNSAIAAVMAKRMKIPVYHMEAGNRCFDLNVPEEINRRLVDHIADFNLVYTEHARRNLLAEGLPPRRVYLSGSPMGEVLAHHRQRIAQSGVLSKLDLEPQKYFVISHHREENVDNKERLSVMVDTLNAIAEKYAYPIIFSTHPRTRKRLDALDKRVDPLIRLMKPLGFIDYNKLQLDAYCTLSDSGTISEESAILGFPAVTVRSAMERPEAMDAGTIVLTGLDQGTILSAIEIARETIAHRDPNAIPDEYKVRNSSERVLKLIIGTCRLSNQWEGIKVYDA